LLLLSLYVLFASKPKHKYYTSPRLLVNVIVRKECKKRCLVVLLLLDSHETGGNVMVVGPALGLGPLL
jgi:hypothetical protein